jgi:GntR family transcriptional regulator
LLNNTHIVTDAYISIASELTRRIQLLGAGERIPSENEIVQEFSISRPTARAAVQELERRFLVRRVKGSGTFVNERIHYPIGPTFPASVSQTLALSGKQGLLRVVSVIETETSADEALHFETNPPGHLTAISRSLSIDDEVVGFGISKISHHIAPDIRRHLGEISSIWRILHEKYGVDLIRRSVTVSLDNPPNYVAAIIESHEPSWHLRSLNIDHESRRVVELGESWLRADRFSVDFTFGIDEVTHPHNENRRSHLRMV